MVNPAEDLLKHCLGETQQLHVPVPGDSKKHVLNLISTKKCVLMTFLNLF